MKQIIIILILLFCLFNCKYESDYYVVHTYKYSVYFGPEKNIEEVLIYVTILQRTDRQYCIVKEGKVIYDLAQEYKIIRKIIRDFKDDEYVGIQ
jgi:hypothetical protein